MIVVASSFSFADNLLCKCLDLYLKIFQAKIKSTADIFVPNVSESLLKNLWLLVN